MEYNYGYNDFCRQYSVTKKGVGDNENEILSYAYEVSNKNKDFVKTIVAENGTVDVRRQSDYVKNGVREPSFGICQIHCGYHKEKCGSYTKPTWEGFYNWEWQVNTCYEMYNEGTAFYGRKRFENDPKFNAKLNALLTFYD